MKKRILLGSIIVVVLTFMLTAFLNRDILRPLLSSEKIGRYEITAIRTSRTNNEARMFLLNNGVEIIFPLPNGAVEFESLAYPVRQGYKQYLITRESFYHYMQEILPQSGFETDQMGGWISISNNNSIQISMSIFVFTRDYMRIEVPVEASTSQP